MAGDCRTGGDETRVASHQFHQSDAIEMASRFIVRGADDPDRLVDRRLITETAPDVRNVVVNSFGNPDDIQIVSPRPRFQVEVVGSAQCAIATHSE